MIVPESLSDPLVVNEFNKSIDEIYEYGKNQNVEMRMKPKIVDFDGVDYLSATFKYIEGFPVVSLIYLTTIFGSFLKVRYTFLFNKNFNQQIKLLDNFMSELTNLLIDHKKMNANSLDREYLERAISS